VLSKRWHQVIDAAPEKKDWESTTSEKEGEGGEKNLDPLPVKGRGKNEGSPKKRASFIRVRLSKARDGEEGK